MITKSDVNGVKVMRLILGLIFVASLSSSGSAQGTPNDTIPIIVALLPVFSMRGPPESPCDLINTKF